MDTKGGRVSITMSGQTFTGRGVAKLMTSNVTLKNGANTNGTGYTTVEASLVSLEVTFDRGIFVWNTAMLLQKPDVTFQEMDVTSGNTVGKVHLLTKSSWDGTPTLDTATGEVTGLKVVTDQYTPPS